MHEVSLASNTSQTASDNGQSEHIDTKYELNLVSVNSPMHKSCEQNNCHCGLQVVFSQTQRSPRKAKDLLTLDDGVQPTCSEGTCGSQRVAMSHDSREDQTSHSSTQFPSVPAAHVPLIGSTPQPLPRSAALRHSVQCPLPLTYRHLNPPTSTPFFTSPNSVPN